jgi:hypothetical protein
LKVIRRLLVGLLIVVIPCIAIGISANILTRLPDLYDFQFTKSQITEEIELTAKPAELAALFSSYLSGKTPAFEFVSEYQGREQQIFTMRDQIGMAKIKQHLNGLLLLVMLMIPIGILLIYWLIKRGAKELIRTAYKYAVLFFGVFWLWILLAPINGFLGSSVLKLIFGSGFDGESLLGLLLSRDFMVNWFYFNFIASAIILFILGNIIWHYTKERRMFVY